MKLIQHPRFDSADSIFFTREVEQLLREQFNVKYAELKGRTLVQTGEMIDPGAETIRYESYNSFGKMKLIANAADDLPQAQVNGTEFFAKMKSYGLAYSYDVQEIQANAMADRISRAMGGPGKSIDRARAEAVRKALAQGLETIIAVGDSTTGALGLLNQTGVLNCTSDSGFTGGWASATADQIINDMMMIVDKIPNSTNEVEQPNRLVLPAVEYRIASRKARSTLSDTTCLQFFKDNRPGIEVVPWIQCAGKGASSKNRAFAYNSDPMNVRLLMAVEYDQLPPEPRNFAFVINAHMRTGGVIAPYPQSICYGDL